MSWPTKKLGDLTEICRGSSPRPICDTKYFEGGKIPWIKIADATKSGKFLYETKEHVNDYGASFSRKLPQGTILVAASGTLGYTQILGVEGCAHDGWLILQNLRDLDRDFAYYALKTLERHFFNSGSGAAIQNINTDILRQAEIPYPPLTVQRNIASILSAYDELIENCQQRIQILEQMARSLYREWFVNFRYPNHAKTPMVDSPLGKIPKGWSFGKLGDVCQVIPGYAFKSNDWQTTGVPVIKIKNIQPHNTVETEATDYVSEEISKRTNSKFVLGNGDILLAMTGATAGKIGRLRTKQPMLLNQRVAKLVPSHSYQEFVWYSVSTEEAMHRFFLLADGAAQPNMSGAQIEGINLLIPTGELAKQFSIVVNPILTQTDNFYIAIQNLRKTRDLLLPRLLSGQINVN